MSAVAVIAIALFPLLEVFPASYYISNNGNDANNGLSPLYPWRTLAKLNSVMKAFAPGDVILFERGSYFLGQVNISCSGNERDPIIFGAYGSGIDPVIGGSLPIKNWSLHQNGIYKAKSDSIIHNLQLNRRQLILARYPNSGFLRVKESLSNPRSGFRDNSLKQPKGYWNEANVRIRTINWAFEYSQVKNFQNGNVAISNSALYPVEKNWGYYFDNKLSELDTINEWYFQKGATGDGVVYFKPPAGVDPNNAFIEGSFIGIGFFSNVNLRNVIIRDLSFVNQTDIGIYLNGNCSRIAIENCSFTGQRKYGVYLPNRSNDVKISNCRFTGINGEALYMLNSSQSTISNNLFQKIGMIQGYGTTGSPFGMSAIVILKSESNLIAGNYINEIGHNGINCIGKSNIIEENVVKNTLLMLNDGGGIKSYGEDSKGTVWKNNFVSDVWPNMSGTPSISRPMGYGLYADAGCRNMRIENNTVFDCNGAGIFLYEGCNDNMISNNVSINNPIGIKFRIDSRNSSGNKVMQNLFVGVRENQFAERLISSKSQNFSPAAFDRNTYVFPRNEALFQFEAFGKLYGYVFDEWKNLFPGNDRNSVSLNGNQFLYPEIFRNMTSDSVRYLLNPSVEYTDNGLKKIYGALTVKPWTSEILYANTDRSKAAALELISRETEFGRVPVDAQSPSKWFVISLMNLRSPVSVKMPDGFLVSTEPDRNFTGSISLTPSGAEQDFVMFIWFAPTAEKGYTGYAEITATGIQRQIRLSGNSR